MAGISVRGWMAAGVVLLGASPRPSATPLQPSWRGAENGWQAVSGGRVSSTVAPPQALVFQIAFAQAAPQVVRLPRPPFRYTYHPSAAKRVTVEAPPSVRLRLMKVSERPNQVTDLEAWLKKNRLSLPEGYRPQPEGGEEPPSPFPGQKLVASVHSSQGFISLYGPDFSGGRFLVGPGEPPAYAFDFGDYIVPAEYVRQDREFVDEAVQWAEEAAGVLYVSNFHRTYAKSSKGLNGYLTCLEVPSGRLRWRSRPLVCNSANFLLHRGVIVTGYGFTKEPDFLYLLDPKTGAVAQTVPLKSGPEHILLKGDRIYVRCYNTDYVFRLASL
jgi:hypothetical protein